MNKRHDLAIYAVLKLNQKSERTRTELDQILSSLSIAVWCLSAWSLPIAVWCLSTWCGEHLLRSALNQTPSRPGRRARRPRSAGSWAARTHHASARAAQQ